MKMKNMKIFSALSAAVLFLSLSLTGCDNFFQPPDTKTKDGKGYVLLRFGLANSRTLFPEELKFEFFTLTPESQDGAPNPSPITSKDSGFDDQKIALDAGNWKVKVEIFIDGTFTDPIGEGTSAEFTVEDDDVTSVEILLTFKSSLGGDGTFVYNITPPNSFGQDLVQEVEMLNLSVGPPSTVLTNTTSTLAAGYYQVTITLTKNLLASVPAAGVLEAKFTDIVHIYPENTTEMYITFEEEDFICNIQDMWIVTDTSVTPIPMTQKEVGVFTGEFDVSAPPPATVNFNFRLSSTEEAWFAPAALTETVPTNGSFHEGPNQLTADGTNKWVAVNTVAGTYEINVYPSSVEWGFTVKFTATGGALIPIDEYDLADWITITAPANGEAPVASGYSYSPNPGRQYAITSAGINWTTDATGTTPVPSTTFVGGQTYYAVFTLEPTGNYTFDGVTPLTLFKYGSNGIDVTETGVTDEDAVKVTVTFLATKGKVDHTALNTYINIPVPADGGDPADFTLTNTSTPSDQYTASNFNWWTNADGTGTVTEFVGAQPYYAVFTLEPEEGFTFDGVTLTSFTYTYLTVDRVVSVDEDGDNVKVTVTFTATGGGTIVPYATLTFTVTDEGKKITPTGTNTIQKPSGNLTLTVVLPSTEFTIKNWYVDGVLKTGDTLTINAGDYRIGTHRVILVIEKGGVLYSSNEVTFHVTAAD
jgi:hypothetical protein